MFVLLRGVVPTAPARALVVEMTSIRREVYLCLHLLISARIVKGGKG